LGPDVSTRAALAEFHGAINYAELGINLHGAGLHAKRSRLKRRPGMPVYDLHPYAAPSELIGEHQPCRTGPDDQNIRIH
jgi:hypothetical protein